MVWPEKTDLFFTPIDDDLLGYYGMLVVQKDLKGTGVFLLEDHKQVGRLRKPGNILIGPAKREFFEDKRIDAIMHVGIEARKDSLHYRRSLTQVEAELAAKNGTTILFSFADLLSARRPWELLGRWAHDLRLLKKYGTPYTIVSGAKNWAERRSRKDLDQLLSVIAQLL